MDSDILKEYLVKIGVDIPIEEIQKFNRHMETFDKGVFGLVKRINNLFSGWKAVGIAYAEAARRIFNFTAGIAKANIETQKFAKRMFLTNDSAKLLSRTLDSMDAQFSDLQDIALNPELFSQYRELLKLGKELTGGKEIDESLRKVREVSFEFTKLKMTFTYLGERIAHYVSKVLDSPAGQAFVNGLKKLNEFFKNNIDKIAQKIATFMGVILRTVIRVGQIIRGWWELLRTGYTWIESRLQGLGKVITAVIATVGAALLLSPIGKLLLLFQGILLLVDDYMGYKEGELSLIDWDNIDVEIKKALRWVLEKIIDGFNFIFNWIIKKIKNKWEEAKKAIGEWWDSLIAKFQTSFDRMIDFFEETWSRIIEKLKNVWNSIIEKLKNAWDSIIAKLEKFWLWVKEFIFGDENGKPNIVQRTKKTIVKGSTKFGDLVEGFFQLPVLGLGKIVLPEDEYKRLEKLHAWNRTDDKERLTIEINNNSNSEVNVNSSEYSGLVITRGNHGGFVGGGG